jgi:hypothetical protein
VDGLLDWYLLGVAAGLGVAAAIPAAHTRERRPLVLVATLALGLAVGLIADFATPWALVAAVVGLVLGLVFLRRLSREAVLVAVLVASALALVPAVGYLEAAATPLLGARLRRRSGGRYAGLRILAKD